MSGDASTTGSEASGNDGQAPSDPAPAPTSPPPRPQYGEYATPEEQRARIRQPAVDPLTHPAAPPAPVEPVAAPATGLSSGRLIDRVFTFGLLGYGLFSVLTTIPSVVDYGTFAASILQTLGVDATLADPAAGRSWGLAAALVLGVGWVAAAGASWLNLRARRLSFWIPLAAGFLCNVLSSVLLLIPLLSDPTVRSALEQALVGTTG